MALRRSAFVVVIASLLAPSMVLAQTPPAAPAATAAAPAASPAAPAAPGAPGAPAATADEKLRTVGPAQIKRDAFGEKKIELTKKAEAKRDEAIEEIKKLLPRVRGKSQEGELVFRLAELYWEKSKYIYQSEFAEFDKAYTKWVDEGRQGKEPLLPQFTKQSDVYKKQSLDNYRVVLERFPDYPRLDEVLYIMAYNEYDAGRTKEAIDNYSQLIRQYPESEYVSDSYLALGEHYFKNNDLPKSTKAYTKAYDIATAKKRPGVANYALYKLAWCDYNAQEYTNALKKFKDVIARAPTVDPTAGDRGGIELKREALNDMVLTYAHLDAVVDAHTYLKQEAGAADAYKLTGKLAAIYKEQGKQALQIDTLRLLLKLDEDNVQAPDYQSSIVEAYAKLNDRANVKLEVTRLVELYRPGSPWWRKNEANKASTERALAVAESRMRELVTDYHRFAQKFKKYDDYDAAANIYDQYLKAFPDSEQAYRLSFFYAELLWDLGKWREAAQQYDAVVKRDIKGEYARTCAYNAVLAWEKIVNKVPPPTVQPNGIVQITDCLPEDERAGRCTLQRNAGDIRRDTREIKKLVAGREYDPQPIPPDEIALAAACDAYVNVVTADPKVNIDAKLKEELQIVKFKAAYIYQSRYHFDEGAKRYGELIDRWPESEYARKGADQILDSYDFRKDYPALEKWSRAFAAKKELLSDAKFAASVARFMEGATFKNTDALRVAYEAIPKGTPDAKKAAVAAAQKFDAFLKEFPKSEFAPLAVYNAQILYANEEILDEAIRWAERLLNEYPKEVTTNETLKGVKAEQATYAALAAYYDKIAQYQTAAEWYVKYADKYGKDDAKSPDSIYNAGIFYLGLGDTETAVKMFTRYMKDFPKQKDIADVYLRIAAIYEDKEDWKRAAAQYGDFEKAVGKLLTKDDPKLLEARYKTALMMQKSGRDKDMLELCKGILASWAAVPDTVKKSDVGATAGGYCGFHTLEPEWLDYKAIKIEEKSGSSGRAGMKAVAEALELKKKKRDEIAKKYFDLKDYGSGEWAVAGLLRAADALLDYTATLRQAPVPKAMANNPEAIDLFIAELENIAFPVEEQGIQALEAALETAFKLGIYSSYTIEIEDRLRKFKPSKFGRIYELPFFPSAASVDSVRTASRS